MTLVYLGVKESDINTQVYAMESGTNQYEKARFRGEGLTLILYTSGKLVVQGSDELLDKFKENNHALNLQPGKEKKQVLNTKLPEIEKCIGSDETLKGDTFGGLVVVGAYFEKSEEDTLKQLGVVDSKQLTDIQIEKIAKILLEDYKERFVIYEIEAKEYNELTKQRSITGILNEAHNHVGFELKKTYFGAKQVVDQYPGCQAGDYMIQKAESFFVAVAAASIVARYYGIEQFNRLSKEAGFVLPKGSTHVEEALKLLKELGKDLSEFAKMHFKNVL
ncbi:hypothetical protein JXA48_01000 [Candidatus Woesearchaeota archaeon]|nr:hypothetical protein [Candidatus Woesearchaeota archaeon]